MAQDTPGVLLWGGSAHTGTTCNCETEPQSLGRKQPSTLYSLAGQTCWYPPLPRKQADRVTHWKEPV